MKCLAIFTEIKSITDGQTDRIAVAYTAVMQCVAR